MLFLDTSALLKRYVDEEGTALVVRLMNEDRTWAVSAIARTEAEIALCALAMSDRANLREQLADDLERAYVVPVDPACLERAAEIGCEHGIRTLDAVHLAAADRLPRPVRLVTFDQRQAVAARGLGLKVAPS